MALLDIDGLTVTFGTGDRAFRAVDGVSLSVDAGEVLGIVGESGSGKSVSSLAVMGLLPPTARVEAQRLTFAGTDLLSLSGRARRRLTGKDVAMVFQDPLTSLNPCYTIGFQIIEALKVHEGGSRRQLRERAVDLLDQVGIPDPRARIDSYPHQLSGGMNQRVVIAMAIACNPKLLIADEPTTALDVTIQAQILDLLLGLQRDRGMALILITHDLAVVAETARRVAVMYAGQVVETGQVPGIFRHPRHPYTAALLEALPERAAGKRRLNAIPGVVPGQYDRPPGCLLEPRCPHAVPHCRAVQPSLRPWGPDAAVRCHTPLDDAGRPGPAEEMAHG
ncbi:MAG: dipeptide ABC transporter ATP-binding protein DppD [Tistrella sp.]|uniref:oligopeptide/dipeptide ABC transporter ATP-binding protein n=1 Tax=Tistrella sp. TaxID=2024861 RepID=UPI000C42430D|nr:oligopeptide/dipeptide ABC transporter ATP-binding protein [Tistrella sp.]MAD37814.1 dipeptide ABC transporter ATP-binding protein DppD [Tistrella sp.]MBA78512.1 dipeptide ABC transporter ATP-binding protein DppD [Tistrella sp.]